MAKTKNQSHHQNHAREENILIWKKNLTPTPNPLSLITKKLILVWDFGQTTNLQEDFEIFSGLRANCLSSLEFSTFADFGFSSRGGLCIFALRFGLSPRFILILNCSRGARGGFQQKLNWNWPFFDGIFEKCGRKAEFCFSMVKFPYAFSRVLIIFHGCNFAIVFRGGKLVFKGVIFLPFSREEFIFHGWF